jgi:TPR repeat protein
MPDEQPEALKIFSEAFEAEAAGNLPDAVQLYQRAANMGFVSAQINLGNIFDDVLKPPRPDLALYWYKRAARTWAAGAMNLAIHYGKVNNSRRRLHWLRKAAAMGDEDAIAELDVRSRSSI